MTRQLYTVLSADNKWNSSWMYTADGAIDAFMRKRHRNNDSETWEECQQRGYRCVCFYATMAAELVNGEWLEVAEVAG